MIGSDQVGAPRPRFSSELRCAYCHGGAERAIACDGCGALLHPECGEQAGGCVTLGCERRTGSSAPVDHAVSGAPMRGPRSRRVENRTLVAGSLVVAAVVTYAAEHVYVWRSPERAVAYTYYDPWLGQNPKDMTLGLQVGFGSPTDPWGGSWRIREPDRLLIDDVYSAGPDRLDENGSGDDVFVPPYDRHELGIAYLLVHARYVLTPLACLAAGLLLWWGASRLEARA